MDIPFSEDSEKYTEEWQWMQEVEREA